MDEDAFLDEMIKRNKFCAHVNERGIQCDRTIDMLGVRCKYCTNIFCMKHALAEEHGCGDQASYVERRAFKNQFLEGQANFKVGTLKDVDREYLKNKLSQKIDKRGEHKTVAAKKKEGKK